MAEAKNKDTKDAKGDQPDQSKRSLGSGVGMDEIRTKIAQVIWLVCVACAAILAVGALCIALKANQDNNLVDFVLTWADKVDLGVFSQEDGIKEFVGKNSDTKNALFNWGLGAIFWLVVGRLGDRIVRP